MHCSAACAWRHTKSRSVCVRRPVQLEAGTRGTTDVEVTCTLPKTCTRPNCMRKRDQMAPTFMQSCPINALGRSLGHMEKRDGGYTERPVCAQVIFTLAARRPAAAAVAPYAQPAAEVRTSQPYVCGCHGGGCHGGGCHGGGVMALHVRETQLCGADTDYPSTCAFSRRRRQRQHRPPCTTWRRTPRPLSMRRRTLPGEGETVP